MPRDIYYKILFELFGNQILEIENDPEFNSQVGRLENTAIFNALYDFQRKGVLSLIRMLQKYDGAILADADRLESYSDRADKFFRDDKPKLIVIDEGLLGLRCKLYRVDTIFGGVISL